MKEPKKQRDKITKNHINRKIKPFVDSDLQLQFPEFSTGHNQDFSYHPIYSHFVSNQVNECSLFSQINESEIIRSMKEAEESFKAWNKMKEKLEQIKNNEENRISPPFLA
ncbi:MAG: hypothetical protein Q8K60_00905 [Parachlamydiaceae bacterium]|nr:hypothetical protein [Parachlamydiaceae bacterium]